MAYKNSLVGMIIGVTIGVTGLILYIPVLTNFFKFKHLTIHQVLLAIGVGAVSVLWFELIKLWKRNFAK